MKQMVRLMSTLGLLAAIVIGWGQSLLYAQSTSDPNAAPNSYRMEEFRVQLPDDRKLGAPLGVEIDHSDGKTLWIYERCGGDSCAGSTVDPVMKLDSSGKMVANFGGGLTNWPHGFYVDRAGDVWITDGRGENGKGQTVIKFSPQGKVLLTLGKPGQAGSAPGMFDMPSDVITAPNGDIFVADGHGVFEGHQTNDRIVKLSKDGTFITSWGKHGSAPGEFDVPHSLAMDSAGRLYVGDRANSRVQVFDQSGNFIAEWKQFGRPSGVYIDKNDTIYVADNQSDDKTNPGFKQGIRTGSVKDGKVLAFIPLTDFLTAIFPFAVKPAKTALPWSSAASSSAAPIAGIAGAAEVTLISVGGVKVALDKIVADYTKATSNQVKYIVGSPMIVSKKLADGEAFDVVVQSVPAMDDYAKLGGVKADTRVKVARGGIGMAIRKEATPPDISTPDAFKKALMQATSIAMTDTAMPNGSGILSHSIFTNAGVMDAIKPKIKVVGLDPGQEQIAKGEIEIGFFNISEIRPFVKFAGAVPPPLQQYTNYDAAVTTKSTAGEAAAALVKTIAASAEHWKSAGMEPAH